MLKHVRSKAITWKARGGREDTIKISNKEISCEKIDGTGSGSCPVTDFILA